MGIFRKKPIEVKATRCHTREMIPTLEGELTAKPGDWIITGIAGERYPCKNKIFRETYEPVDAEAHELWGKN